MIDLDADLPAHIEHALDDFLRDAAAPVRHVEPFDDTVQALSRFVLNGGKRLRPTFAWWGWRASGGDASGEYAAGVLHAVSAIELIQAAALIHDDVMDDSDERRGSPTVHIAFAAEHAARGWHGSGERFGLAAAILAGDLALVWADDMFSAAPLPAEMLERARTPWRAMRSEVLAGQYLDVHTQATGDTAARSAEQVNELKTAAYTVARPLHIGAALAGAADSTVEALRFYGHDVGVAFQLRDDLLGIFGDPVVTGKPAGDDLREGKRTLLVARGLQQATGSDAAAISAAIGDSSLSDATLARARQALHEVGAVDAIEREIDALLQRALDTVDHAQLPEPATTALANLARSAAHRQR